MAWKRSEKLNRDGLYEFRWDTPVLGVDRDSGDTQVRPNHVIYTENMRLQSGRPIGMSGYSLLDTGMDADDNATPAGFGQYVSGSTEQYIIIQADGKAQRWNAAGNAWVQLFTGLTVSKHWNELNYFGYLIWANRDMGMWKWDGSNFLPLGARIISDCESDQDGQWAGETAETTIVKEGVQSYAFAALTAGQNDTLTFTPTTNLDLTTALGDAPAYSASNASLGFFIYITDASEFDEAASYVEIATSSGVNELQMPASAWIDKATGTTVVFADNTWHQIELPLNDANWTETGTFDLSDVDTLTFYVEEDGGSGFTAYLDCIYIIYQDGTYQMPGCETLAVWDDVLIAGYSDDTDFDVPQSLVFFARAGAPDYFEATAALSVNPDAGGGVRAVKRFFNQVFVGKENSCHSIGGTIAGTTYPNYNFELIDITDEHGCDGHRSIVEADRKLWFPHKSTYRLYDGTGTKRVSEVIETDLQDHEETLLTSKTSVLYSVWGEIWLAYPGNGDSTNARRVLILPGDEENPASFLGVQDSSTALNLELLKIVYESGQEKIVGIDNAGDIMWLDDTSVTDFDGTAITRTIRFPWVGHGDEMYFWQDLAVLFDAQSSGTISVQFRTADHPRAMDAAGFSTATTLALSSAGNLGWAQIYQVARWIQIQITSSATFFDIEFPLILRGNLVGQWL